MTKASRIQEIFCFYLSTKGQLENQDWNMDWTELVSGLDWTGLDWTFFFRAVFFFGGGAGIFFF